MTTRRGLLEPGPTPTHYYPAGADLLAAAQQQADWARTAAAAVDPQAWLFTQRDRLRTEGVCDPWAEQLLYRAGMLPRR